MLQAGREKVEEWTRTDQSDSFPHSPNRSIYFGLSARSGGEPLTEPARSRDRSKHVAARRPGRLHSSVSGLSRTRTDLVTRLAFASRSSAVRRSSGSLN